jgi:hypothetical protein
MGLNSYSQSMSQNAYLQWYFVKVCYLGWVYKLTLIPSWVNLETCGCLKPSFISKDLCVTNHLFHNTFVNVLQHLHNEVDMNINVDTDTVLGMKQELTWDAGHNEQVG